MKASADPEVLMQDMPPINLSSKLQELEKVPGELRHTKPPTTQQSRSANEVKLHASDHSDVERPLHTTTRPQGVLSGEDGDEESEKSSVDAEDTFPEGGMRAWLAVASAWLLLFTSFGFMVSIGTLQDHWSQHQLASMPARDIGWIASTFVYLALALGIWTGPLFDRYGPRWTSLSGSIAFLLMIFLLAECDRFWQMMCCTVLGGIGGAMLTTTSLAVVAHWFKKRRGLAQGIAMTGSSCGGLTIPLTLRTTLPNYGYGWSLRILGFMFLLCFIVGNSLMKARISPTAKRGSIVSFAIFKDLRFSLFTLSIFGLEIVLFGGIGILPTYATLSTNFPTDTGFYLVSVLNGVSFLGRLLPGYLADEIGRFNTLLLMFAFTLVWMLALWLPLGTTSLAALYAFAALFDFGTGSWMALIPACVGQLCRAEEFGRYYGSMFFVASFAALVCIPISGELVENVGPQALVAFFSAVLAPSSICLLWSRWACFGRRWVVKAKV